MSRTGQRPPVSQGHKRNQAPSQQGNASRQPGVRMTAKAGLQGRAMEEPGQRMAANQPQSQHQDLAQAQAQASLSHSTKQPKLTSLLRSSEYGQQRQQGEAEGWKSAVHRYISLYNQAETEQHVQVLSDFVTDAEHCERLRCRLERLRDRELLRGVLPAGSETKAELVRVNESPSEVSVLIKLHIRRRMEQRGRFYMEERSEYERLWLCPAGRSWDVMRVEPIISERRPRYGASTDNWMTVDDYTFSEGERSMPSMPYLNYDLFPQFKLRQPGIPYRRDLVAAYADRWWNEGNPSFELFEVNCTNYVSQCVFAGNAPMNYTGKRESGWWYKGRNKGQEAWSFSWAVSNALTHYLSGKRTSGLRAESVFSADELQLGDIITYDWNGDNRFQHSTIVTAFDAAGMPLVNANTVASRHRYWDYRDSYAWTEQTKYRFFHIADLM